MQATLKKYLTKLAPYINVVRRYSVAISIVIIVTIFGFLVWRIGTLANAEPNDTAIEETLAKVKRPRIDPEAIKKLQELQGHNVDIQALFPTDRNNPFQE